MLSSNLSILVITHLLKLQQDHSSLLVNIKRFYTYVFKENPIVFSVLLVSTLTTALAESIGLSLLISIFFQNTDTITSFKWLRSAIELMPGNSLIAKQLLLTSIFFVIKALANFTSQFWSSFLTSREEFRTANRLSKLSLNLEWEYFLSQDIGSISGVILRETGSYANTFYAGIKCFVDFSSGIFYLIICLNFNQLFLLSLWPVLFLIPLLKYTGSKIKIKSQQLLNLRLSFSATIVEALNYFKTSKGADEYFQNQLDENISNAISARRQLAFFEALAQSLPQPMVIIFLAFSFAFLSKMQLASASDFTIFVTMIYRSLSYFISSGSLFQSMLSHLPSFFSCLNSLKIWEENQTKTNPEGLELKKISDIRIDSLNFSYKSNPEKIIIREVNAEFSKGDIIGLFGPSGSGKSTVIGLILGLLKPKSGSVYFNGIDISKINRSSVKKLLHYVPQDPILHKGTIGFNLMGNNPIPPNDYIKKLLGKLKLNSLNQDSPVLEGGRNLSGGQKQRISVLKGYIHNPDVIILDEPTSSLDNESKQIILDLICESQKNKITIISTHDELLKSVCNKIISFD